MTEIKGVEPLIILPDRLAITEFTPIEAETITGTDPASEEANTECFNWVAAYLCEQAGLLEEEVTEWFRQEAASLDYESPLGLWQSGSGFIKVFDYARQYKRQIDEDMAEERANDTPITRSHELARPAFKMITRAFEVAGIDVETLRSQSERMLKLLIHNPSTSHSVVAEWKGCQSGDECAVNTTYGTWRSSYRVSRWHPQDAEPFIMQSGIWNMDTASEDMRVDSDLHGQPPSAGEIAQFIVPLAAEVKNRTLTPVGAQLPG